MLSAIVAIDGPLGDVVMRSLESATHAWRAQRVSPERTDCAIASAAIVIVDETLAVERQRVLGDRSDGAILVIGRDVEKPFSVATLRAKALSLCSPPRDEGIVAVDAPLRRALRIIGIAAPRTSSVLVTGPTGVGKERLARRLHTESKRSGAFVAINCAALVDGLAESTLFGHARGAFTGALHDARGAFVEADRGTLFLDEVGELDARMQAKLLRVLEGGHVRPLGAPRDREVDVRIVAATNRDLTVEMEHGRFRSDLYFRLATFVVDVPPLSVRPADLQALVRRLCRAHDRGAAIRFTAQAHGLLCAYAWPGNVRELENVIERALSLATGGELDVEELLSIAPELGGPRAAADSGRVGVLARREREAIDDALATTAGRARAAEELGIHRSTLWRKMKRLREPSS